MKLEFFLLDIEEKLENPKRKNYREDKKINEKTPYHRNEPPVGRRF
jgi:hypothetical protein